jgi:hypothetical protein
MLSNALKVSDQDAAWIRVDARSGEEIPGVSPAKGPQPPRALPPGSVARLA